jgi:hypothetical protein
MALFLYAVIICLRKGTEAVFVSLFSFFTASAIISSFIISYDFPADISARFFVSAVCFAIVMVVLAFSCTKRSPLHWYSRSILPLRSILIRLLQRRCTIRKNKPTTTSLS